MHVVVLKGKMLPVLRLSDVYELRKLKSPVNVAVVRIMTRHNNPRDLITIVVRSLQILS
jgi:hypothetical protein